MPNITRPPFLLRTVADQDAVRHILYDLLAWLQPLELGKDARSIVEIVMAEVLNNIIEHAFAKTDGRGDLCVECTHKSDGLHFIITDQGAPMPNAQLPPGLRPGLDTGREDLPEGGFGWFLIKELSNDISYAREGSENKLRVRLAVGMDAT